MNISDLTINDLPGELTVRIKIARQFRIRMTLSLLLMRLAALIAPMRMKVEQEWE